MSRIMITGATGHLGHTVVDELVNRGLAANVSILARDLTKARIFENKGIQIIPGNYEDYPSLVKAFKGIDRLYFISGNDLLNRDRQHEQVVKAATEAGVGHLIYTSFQRKSEEAASPIALIAATHLLTEKLIKASGLTYTIMKHALYAEGLPMFLTNQVLNSGLIYLPAADGKASFTSRADMAMAGVAVLTGEGHENKSYEISVNKSYSFYDIAQLLTELSGKQIVYTSPDTESFSTALLHAGIPHDNIKAMVSFCAGLVQGEFDHPSTDLKHLIGRQPESLREYLKREYRI